MRTLFAFVFILSTACAATGPRPVNVASVRGQIAASIREGANDRTILSMGKVTNDHAVVYTTLAGGARQEETWVHAGRAWKLEKSTKLSQN